MSLTISKSYLAGKNPISIALGDTDWHCISREGAPYDTVALLLAAGDHCAGDYGNGAKAGEVLVRTVVTASNADGSAVGLKFDTVTTPTVIGDADIVVSGAGQQVSDLGPWTILWVRLTGSSDVLKLTIRY